MTEVRPPHRDQGVHRTSAACAAAACFVMSVAMVGAVAVSGTAMGFSPVGVSGLRAILILMVAAVASGAMVAVWRVAPDRVLWGVTAAASAVLLPGIAAIAAAPGWMIAASFAAVAWASPGVVFQCRDWATAAPDQWRRACLVLGIGAFVVMAAAYDAFGDVACLDNCVARLLPIHVTTRPVIVIAAALAAASAVCGIASIRTHSGSGSRRPLDFIGQVGLIAIAGASLIGVMAPGLTAARAVWMGVIAVAVGLVEWGVLTVGWRARQMRATLTRLAARLEAELASDDSRGPMLEFQVPGSARWINQEGRYVEDVTEQGASSAITAGDGQLAVRLVTSGRDLVSTELEDLEPLDALTVANARMTALDRLREREVAESRRLVVIEGDRERRRIERDLHDGAQQGLVSVRLHLAVAASQREPSDAQHLEQAQEEIQVALSALREICSDLVPYPIDRTGPSAALSQLMMEAKTRGTVTISPPDWPCSDLAATHTVLELVRACLSVSDAAEEPLTGAIRGRSNVVEVILHLPATTTPDTVALSAILDRVTALGGSHHFEKDSDRVTLLVEVPCAS